MTLIVPVTGSLASLLDVEDRCLAIEQWSEQCQSVPELRDASNKLAAIDEYLSRTSIEGRARVAAAMRRLEVRIGQLLGPAENRGPATPNHGKGFNDRQRNEFRQMAGHQQVVEQVIAESTDEAPASRRKVMDAIQHDSGRAAPRRPLTDDWRSAVLDLARITERIERLCRDDRFRRNASQIADCYLSDLTRAQEALQRAIDQLQGA